VAFPAKAALLVSVVAASAAAMMSLSFIELVSSADWYLMWNLSKPFRIELSLFPTIRPINLVQREPKSVGENRIQKLYPPSLCSKAPFYTFIVM